jgi:glycosyltransferase involved in cell wall biosynthesis
VAVRNGASGIQGALDSVFGQAYPNVEVVVMDGASTDGTQAVIERNADRIAYWESEPDRGVYHAWNKALDHVSGDWIAFLGADDRYRVPDALAAVAGAIVADRVRHRVVYADLDKHYQDGRATYEARGKGWTERRSRRFRQGIMLPHQATFHHVSMFTDLGRFDERFRIGGDYEFLLRELLDHPPLHVPLVVADMAGGGLSADRAALARERHVARRMHGLVRAPSWASRSLYLELAGIWRDVHVRPRVRRFRARVSR